ncbi:MAG: hypothetical protein WBA76_06825 [Phormidesmis sp.]
MLSVIIAQLEQLIAQVNTSGLVAAADARLDISTHSKSGHEYARLRSGGTLSACGRVGSDRHLEVLATLHRRDVIAQLTQAIAALKQANEISVAIFEPFKALSISMAGDVTAPAIAPVPKSTPVARKQKTRGRKRLYTHVKTKQGSVIHAVLGKDKVGEWRTPALCGATPPQRDRMGWEFPVHDDGVSCAKCYRKLPANGKRHLPSFG